MRLVKHIEEKLSMDDWYFRNHGMRHDDVIVMIEKNCKKFLAEIMGGGLLWRGSNNKYKAGEVVKPRANRKPRNTDPRIHSHLNKLMKEKYGWKGRNGVFVSGGYSPSIYGDGHIFFPIGNYKYLWNPKIDDLYDTKISTVDASFDNWQNWFTKKKRSFTITVNGYKDTGLKEASRNRAEISFKVSKYYMIPNDGELLRLMSEAWNLK